MVDSSFPHAFIDPRRVNSFLDTCAFDPKYSPEHEAAQVIRDIGDGGTVSLILAHSNQREIEHPNTPQEVKSAAQRMIFTLPTNLNSEEVKTKSQVHAILTGNGKPEKYEADAAHIFEAGKYGGYFITTDDRILSKRSSLRSVTQAVILKPSEWLEIYHAPNPNQSP